MSREHQTQPRTPAPGSSNADGCGSFWGRPPGLGPLNQIPVGQHDLGILANHAIQFSLDISQLEADWKGKVMRAGDGKHEPLDMSLFRQIVNRAHVVAAKVREITG